MSLDDARDYAVEALAALAKGAVNAKLQTLIGQDAIRKTFGAPLPLPLLPQPIFPALCIYRLTDKDTDKGDYVFEDVNAFRFDYYVGATPLDRIDTRWPLLRQVWEVMLGVLRIGRDPSVADEAEILKDGGLFRYVLGSGKAEYIFAPGNKAYPMLRGTMAFDGCYPSPDSFYDDLDKRLRLDKFETLAVDWDLLPELNSAVEAQSLIKPPQT